MAQINNSVGSIVNTANGVMDKAQDVVNQVNVYVNDAQHYDSIREKVVTAIFAFVIAFTVSIAVGYVMKMKLIFNIVAGIGIIFLFLLWFLGSLHFTAGMFLSDACPVVPTVVQELIPNNTDEGRVLQGCLYGTESIFQALNITAFNLSTTFNYKQDFDEFADFVNEFNFSSVDDYLNQINQLYTYNLTAVAANLTAESFGWNQSVIYDTLDHLNEETTPDVFGLNNYTNAVPNNYPPPRNQSVYDLQQLLTEELQENQTIYEKLGTAKQDLDTAQDHINILLANFTNFDGRYAGIKQEVITLETTNISNCIDIINVLQNNITGFFELGNCTFLEETYNGILLSLCGTMQPAIDLLTIAMFLAGLALIPMVIVSEVLSYRINKDTQYFGGDYEEEDEYVTVIKDKEAAPRATLTATVAAADDDKVEMQEVLLEES